MTDPIAEGWRAADVDPSELVDDDWIAANTKPAKNYNPVRHQAARAKNAVARTVKRTPKEG